MVNWNQIEREEDRIMADYAEGLISNAEMNAQMRELHRDAQDAAREEAEAAYEASMDANGFGAW